MRNPLTYLSILLLLFSACSEVIDVDLNKTDQALVVEGLITDQPGPYTVKLTLSTSYFENQPAPAATNALVTITENSALIDTLQEVKAGVYQTVNLLQAQIGSTYDLKIVTDGEVYESSTVLLPVTPIDSLTYKFIEKSVFRDEGYYLSIWAQEPEGQGDYYRWLYYSNGALYDSLELIYASDEFVDGNYIAGFEFFYTQELGDTVRVEQRSLNEDAYEFYRQLDEQESFGNLFDTPPANITGNISNGGLGLFEACAIETKEIIIQ